MGTGRFGANTVISNRVYTNMATLGQASNNYKDVCGYFRDLGFAAGLSKDISTNDEAD